MPLKGYKQREEHKRKIGLANSVALKGKKTPPFSEKHRKNISIARKKRKERLGFLNSFETRNKISIANKVERPWMRGEKSPINENKNWNWKGDNAGKRAKHHWVIGRKGKPETCEHCGKTGLKGHQISWANIDHKYRRILDDYIRLCVRCHLKYDIEKGIRYNNFIKNSINHS